MTTEAQLIRILHECWHANGNAFPSPDADLMFRQLYAGDWTNGNESNADIFNRLLEKTYKRQSTA